MASAPRPDGPGTTAGNEKVDAARSCITITIRGESRQFRPGALTFAERAIVRKATGLPVESYFGDESSIGEDSIQVMWWLAGRSTDPFLTLTKVLDAWPAALGPEDFDVVVDDGEGDDSPEA